MAKTKLFQTPLHLSNYTAVSLVLYLVHDSISESLVGSSFASQIIVRNSLPCWENFKASSSASSFSSVATLIKSYIPVPSVLLATNETLSQGLYFYPPLYNSSIFCFHLSYSQETSA